MGILAKGASAIRHSKLLQNSEWLWDLLRKPYHRLLNLRNKGVIVTVSDDFFYRVPPQYYYVGIEDYEPENVGCLIAWIKKNPECLVLDIGCSLGYMSVISLFASRTAKVIGFDADLSSLRATLKMCSYAPSKNISVVYGLIAEKAKTLASIPAAIKNTGSMLAASSVTGDPGTTVYANLDTAGGDTPYYAIDNLFESEVISQPVLIKCDIEGAELFALKGAENFITKNRPAILLSVHPHILPVFNCTVAEVSEFLAKMDYTIKLIAVDHEEHWWCLPKEI